MKTRKYRILLSALALCLVLALASCTKPPELSEIKDELISLIEGSHTINEIFFGKGLDAVDADIYEAPTTGYEYVDEHCPYQTTTSLKLAAEAIYSAEYLEGVYLTAFEGYADESVGIIAARFLDYEGFLIQEQDIESQLNGTKKYDYDTMKIVKPSSADYINVEIACWLEGVENADQFADLPGDAGALMRGERVTVTLSFVLTVEGWRLDSPTY